MRHPWVVKTVVPRERHVFATKKAAGDYARHWVEEHGLAAAASVLRRKDGQEVLAVRYRDGALESEPYTKKKTAARSRRQARSASERVDIALQDLGIPLRTAVRVRKALFEIWKRALEEGQIIEVPTGYLFVEAARPARRRIARFRKTLQRADIPSRKLRLRFRPNRALLPRPATTVLSFRSVSVRRRLEQLRWQGKLAN